ncbi:MAG: diacylglycerol kinase family protein [Bacteroidales bacterium]|nr:diacylglycerol kinase family protein [Bacteroidales bacterium]
MKNEKFSIRKRIKSFGYAFAGIKVMLREEHNARIHVVAAVVAVALGLLFGITPGEWTAVVIVIAMVFAAEAVNSAIERTADFVKAERDDRKRDIKDLAAGAVLLCAIGAAVVGIIIFLPYLISFINSLL